jgi:predicted 2-oxoglutarate/Fe(II)-dependent dioxygenase YbiX
MCRLARILSKYGFAMNLPSYSVLGCMPVPRPRNIVFANFEAYMELIAHSERVFGIENFLSHDECNALMAQAEQRGFIAASVRTVAGQKLMQNIRNNERAQYEAPEWIALLWQRLARVTMPILDGQSAKALPKDVRFYKYSQDQRFKMHKDGSWTESNLSSKLTFLIYLNDDFAGGETDFREFKIHPKEGAALLFIHDTWHEGAMVIDGVKYVFRSDVLYG